MSIITRTEFAALVGKSPGYINTYIGRNKIMLIESGPDKGKIDTDNALNLHFQKNLKRKERGAVKKKTVPKATLATSKKVVPKQTEAEKKNDLEQKKLSAEYAKWERRKEKANAIRAEKEAELKTLQVEKMMGQLIPVDLVHQILKINIQNVFVSFESELINIASIYCDILAGGDRGKLSEIITKMRHNLERIIDQTKKNSAKEIEGTVDEYSETRNRGERS